MCPGYHGLMVQKELYMVFTELFSNPPGDLFLFKYTLNSNLYQSRDTGYRISSQFNNRCEVKERFAKVSRLWWAIAQ